MPTQERPFDRWILIAIILVGLAGLALTIDDIYAQPSGSYRMKDEASAIRFVFTTVENVTCGDARSAIQSGIDRHGIPDNIVIDTGLTGFELQWARPWGIVRMLTGDMNRGTEDWEQCMTRFVIDDSMTYGRIHAD